MSTALRALLLAVVFTVLPVGVGVAMTGGHRVVALPAYTPTALADLDTTTLTVPRAAFCDRISGDAVSAALGRVASVARAYVDGQRQSFGGAKADMVHEDGCVFRAGSVEARAWVFAPPVTRAWARTLLHAPAKGCRKAVGAAAFGSPSAASVCGGATRTATYRGLFGDAWLSCSLARSGAAAQGAAADAALVLDADRWCAAVAQAAAAPAAG